MQCFITFDLSQKKPFKCNLIIIINSTVRLHEYNFDGFYQCLLITRPFARKEIVKETKRHDFARPSTCQQSVMMSLYVLKQHKLCIDF